MYTCKAKCFWIIGLEAAYQEFDYFKVLIKQALLTTNFGGRVHTYTCHVGHSEILQIENNTHSLHGVVANNARSLHHIDGQ